MLVAPEKSEAREVLKVLISPIVLASIAVIFVIVTASVVPALTVFSSAAVPDAVSYTHLTLPTI